MYLSFSTRVLIRGRGIVKTNDDSMKNTIRVFVEGHMEGGRRDGGMA